MDEINISLEEIFLALLPQLINDERKHLTYVELTSIWMDAAREIHQGLQEINNKISKSKMD